MLNKFLLEGNVKERQHSGRRRWGEIRKISKRGKLTMSFCITFQALFARGDCWREVARRGLSRRMVIQVSVLEWRLRNVFRRLSSTKPSLEHISSICILILFTSRQFHALKLLRREWTEIHCFLAFPSGPQDEHKGSQSYPPPKVTNSRTHHSHRLLFVETKFAKHLVSLFHH